MHTIDSDCWCHVCTQAKADLRAQLAATEAALAAVTAERDYLREYLAWREAMATSNLSDACQGRIVVGVPGGMCGQCKAWLAANPEPVPPEGVAP